MATHGHADHIAGVERVAGAFAQAVFTAPGGDETMLSDPMANLSAMFGLGLTAPPAGQIVQPGDALTQGGLTWDILDTAGPTPGGVSFLCRQAGTVIVGDALFAGSIGRCDFPRSDQDTLVSNIGRNLLTLPDQTRVLCGHGPETTIGAERRHNPYL